MTSRLLAKPCCVTVLVAAFFVWTVPPGQSQILLAPAAQTPLELKPNESKVVLIAGEPHSLQVLEIHLDGGLISLKSPETVRRLLDLGRTGRLFFAVEVPESGQASVEFTSSERLRNTQARLEIVTRTLTPEQQAHLHTAGITFALADSARRRQRGAPSASVALEDYEQAAVDAIAAGDPSMARWALTQKARFLLYQKSSFVETRQVLERAAALGPSGDFAAQALLYKTLSSCEYFLGNLPESVREGEHALELYRQTGDQYWQGVVLGNLIAGYGEMGRNDDAEAAAREALTDAEQTQDTAGVVFCLTELANLYKREGSLQLALQTFREAQAWAQDIRYAPLVQAEIEQDLGQFYLDFGLWTEAQAQLEECLKHASANSAPALEARGLLARAIDRRGDHQAAIRQYNLAIDTARELKLSPQEANLLIGRSASLLQAHRGTSALEDARNAVHLAEQLKSPSLRIQAALAEAAACLEACSDKSEAAQIYHEALQWIEQSGEREEEAAAYAGLARVDAALSDPEGGLQNIERALSLLEHSRASIASRGLAGSYFAARHDWYILATGLAMQLDSLHPGQGYSERAFQLSERGRARALLDALGDLDANDRAETSPRASTTLLRRIAANQYRIDAQKAQLLADDDPQKTAVELQSLYREQDALEGERKTQLAFSPAFSLSEIAPVSSIQAGLLDDHTALVAVAPGERTSYRWLITRKSIRVDKLPPIEDLYHRLDALRHLLQQRRPSPVSGEDAAAYAARIALFDKHRALSLQSAGELLLSHIPPEISHLYLVADGTFPAIPWNVLRTNCKGHTCYAIERYALSIEPSASAAAALASRAINVNRHGALVVSDTVPFDAQDIPRWRRLQALPGSQREAHTIATLLPATSFHNLHRADATVSNVEQALRSDPEILHLAAHTLFVVGHPELSGIALSAGHDRSKSTVESILWLHDIPRLNAPPLVVLSGCTTEGASLSNEELASLAQAFFYAGAQQVIASSWEVDDDPTVKLMGYFYRNLIVRKMPADDALRSAQLLMLAEHADLADWAAFLINGVPAKAPAPESERP